MARKKKILIVTDDAGESFEILYAQHRFAESGWRPVIGATKKKALRGVIHDFEPGWTTYVEKPGYRIEADIALSQAKPKDYDAVMLIGGRAPEHLRHHTELIKFIQEFHQSGKWIFSVCHGIQILAAAGLLKGARSPAMRMSDWKSRKSGANGSTSRAWWTETLSPPRHGKATRIFTGTFSGVWMAECLPLAPWHDVLSRFQ